MTLFELLSSIYAIFIIHVFKLFYFNYNTICGQDKFMIMSPESEYKNYPMVKFKLNKSHKNLFDFIIEKYKFLIVEKKSVFRRKYIDEDTFSYSDETADEIINYTFNKLESVNKCNKSIIVKNTIKNSNKISLWIANDGFIICASHLLHDGTSLLNTTAYLSDNKALINLPVFYYIPVFNEIKTIYDMCRGYYDGIPKRNLSLDYPRDSTDYHNMIKTKIQISYIKELKSLASSSLKEKVSFALVFSAIQTFVLFQSSKKERLTVGIVVGFKNTNRFNNFTAIVLDIKRPVDLSYNTDNLLLLIEEMHKEGKRKMYQIPLFYSLTNVYNLPIYLNKTIDVLFSGIPMCQTIQHSIDNIEIGDVFVTMPYHTSPVYIFNISDTKYIYITQHFRTKDIQIKEVENINNKIINFKSSKD